MRDHCVYATGRSANSNVSIPHSTSPTGHTIWDSVQCALVTPIATAYSFQSGQSRWCLRVKCGWLWIVTSSVYGGRFMHSCSWLVKFRLILKLETFDGSFYQSHRLWVSKGFEATVDILPLAKRHSVQRLSSRRLAACAVAVTTTLPHML